MGQLIQRYYGYYANRTRGERRKAKEAAADTAGGEAGGADASGVTIVERDIPRGDARCRWAELLRLIYEIDPLQCPKCGGPMRVIAVIRDPKVVDKILRHLRAQGRDARAAAGRRWWRLRGGRGERGQRGVVRVVTAP